MHTQYLLVDQLFLFVLDLHMGSIKKNTEYNKTYS